MGVVSSRSAPLATRTAFFGYAALLFVLTHVPKLPSAADPVLVHDKWVHATAYLIPGIWSGPNGRQIRRLGCVNWRVYRRRRIVVGKRIPGESQMPKPQSLSGVVQRAIRADGRSLYRIAKDSDVAVAVLQRFMSGERGITLRTADRICPVIGLELRPVKKTKGR